MVSTKTKLNTIINTNSEMHMLSDGILHITYKKGVMLEVADIVELQNAYERLPEPKPDKILQELSPYSSMSSEARQYAAEHSPAAKGVAYVIHNLAQRLIIKFYVQMWKRKKPTKVFDSFYEAIEWLEKL